MVSELLRHSDRPEVCERIPEYLRLCHRPKHVTRDDAPVIARSKAAKATAVTGARMCDLFTVDTEWQLGPLAPVSVFDDDGGCDGGGDHGGGDDDDDDDDLLDLAGF